MSEEMNSVTGEVATSTETEGATTTTSSTTVEGTSVQNNSQVATSEPTTKQDDKTNSAFAEMRRRTEALEKESSQYKKDLQVSKKFGKDGIHSESDIAKFYGKQGITTIEQLEDAIEAQQKGQDPEMKQQIKNLESRLSKYERKESFSKDHERLLESEGKVYEKLAEQSKEIAEKFNVDLETGYTLALKANAKELSKEPDIQKIKDDAIREYIDSLKKGNNPVLTSNGGKIETVSTPKTLEEARSNALAMLRGQKT